MALLRPRLQEASTLTAAQLELRKLLHPEQPRSAPPASGYENIPTIGGSSVAQLQQQLVATQRALQVVRNEAASYEHDLTELRWRCVTLGVPTSDTGSYCSTASFGARQMRPPRTGPQAENEFFSRRVAASPVQPASVFVMSNPPTAASIGMYGAQNVPATTGHNYRVMGGPASSAVVFSMGRSTAESSSAVGIRQW